EGSINIQSGANQGDTMGIPTSNLADPAGSMGAVLDSSFGIGSAADASAAIGSLQGAMDQLASTRADIGASANRLDMTAASLQSQAEAQAVAQGRIMDADYARETARMASMQILQQSGTAMMAQGGQMSAAFVQGMLG
ncbi:MAG: flagellin FliC, partial [Gammaproteobacteria bacterium]|nr:flagellin FliC [Gammaproteobacteria bacterium]